MVGCYRFLDDVALADCALEIEAGDRDELFETAAAALAEVMVDPATVPPTVTRSVTLSAARLDLLLYDWLSELIFRKDRDREVFTRVTVHLDGEGPVRLRAELVGGVLDRDRVALRADPKAVTFHQFAVGFSEARWRARLVIDI